MNRSLAILLVISLFVSMYFLYNYREVSWDAAQYLKLAEYWYKGTIAFRNFQWSPILSFYEYLIFLLTGENIVALKISYSIFLPLLLLSVYKFTEYISDKKTALFASLLTFSNHTVLFWSTRLYTDIPGAMLLFAYLYVFSKGTKENSEKWYFVSGILLGLAVLMRIPNLLIAFLVSIAILYYFKRFNIKKLIFVLSSLIPIFIFELYLLTESTNILKIFFGYSSTVGSFNLFQNIQTFINSAGIPLLALGFFTFIWKKYDIKLAMFLLSLGIFLIMPFPDPRYAIPAVIFLSIFSSQIHKKIKRAFPILILLIFLLNFGSVLEPERAGIYCSENSALVNISDYIRNHSNENTIIFSQNYWPQIEWYSKRKTYAMIQEAPWLDEIIKAKKVKFIITTEKDMKIKYLENFTIIKTFKDNCRTLYLWGEK